MCLNSCLCLGLSCLSNNLSSKGLLESLFIRSGIEVPSEETNLSGENVNLVLVLLFQSGNGLLVSFAGILGRGHRLEMPLEVQLEGDVETRLRLLQFEVLVIGLKHPLAVYLENLVEVEAPERKQNGLIADHCDLVVHVVVVVALEKVCLFHFVFFIRRVFQQEISILLINHFVGFT